MGDNELLKRLCQAKKSECIIFAATPELKQALETVAREQCISVSAIITWALANELAKNKDLLEEVGE